MDLVSGTRFEIQILSHCQDFCRSVQIKNCIKEKKFLLYLLKYDRAKMKTFIAAFLEALTFSISVGDLMMPRGGKKRHCEANEATSSHFEFWE